MIRDLSGRLGSYRYNDVVGERLPSESTGAKRIHLAKGGLHSMDMQFFLFTIVTWYGKVQRIVADLWDIDLDSKDSHLFQLVS